MTYPYIPARLHGGAQSAIDRIVIHATVSPCVKGGARNVAKYFQGSAAGGSAHYVVDPGEIVQCVRDDVVAYHAPPNTGSLGIELCDPQSGREARWADAEHTAMLGLAAKLVRELCAKYDVPVIHLTTAGVRGGTRGICGHAQVSEAFRKSDHGDPDIGGKFPWDRFMKLITEEDGMATPKEIWGHKIPKGQNFEGEWAAETHMRYQSAQGADLKERLIKIEAQGAGIIADMDKRVRLLSAENAELKASLAAANAKLDRLLDTLAAKG